MFLGTLLLILLLLCIAWTKVLAIMQHMRMKKKQSENQTTCTSSTGTTEESTDAGTSRDIPQPMDIILGRGKGNTKNPGNIIFQGKYEG
jgi:hypothetical protein